MLAAELVGRFKMDRGSLPAFSLGENSAVVTSLANDYSFDDVFARQIEGLGQRFSGLYYVTTTSHTLSARLGYQTAFTVRRNAT